MKKAILPCLTSICIILSSFFKSSAKTDCLNPYGEPFKILTTAYCDYGPTRSGCMVREGICACKKEWLGKTVIAYERNEDGSIGELLGIWECLDTGFGADSDGDGIGSIQEGKVIDMYFKTIDECKNWMKKTKGKIYIQLVDGVG